MSIDRRLYQKYTGKLPGEAMNRFGESLAKSAGEQSRRGADAGGSTFARALRLNFKIRLALSVAASIAALIAILFGLV